MRPWPVANLRGQSASGLHPSRMPNCRFWVQADVGFTGSKPQPLSANDFSNSAWTAANIGARTTNSLTDSVDATPASHRIYQLLSGVRYGTISPICSMTLEAKADTKSIICLTLPASGASNFFNLASGVCSSVSGQNTAKMVALEDGWWRCTVTGPFDTNPYFGIFMADSMSSTSYRGDGTGKLLIRNASVDQQLVQTLQDQSGFGQHLTQATSAKQPVLSVDPAYNQPVLCFASSSLATTTWVSTINQPNTIVLIGDSLGTFSSSRYLVDGIDATNRQAIYGATTSGLLSAYAGGTPISAASAVANAKHAIALVSDGSRTSLYVDSSAAPVATGDCGSNAMAGLTVGSNYTGSSGYFSGRIGALGVYAGARTKSEVAAIFRWFRRFGGNFG